MAERIHWWTERRLKLSFSPHWRVGFLFLVLYPLRPPPVLPSSSASSRTHSLTHSLTDTHSLTLTHWHSLTDTHSLTLTHWHSLTDTHSLTLTHWHSLTDTHSLTLTHWHSLTDTHSLTLTHWHSLTDTHSLTHTHWHSLTDTHSLTLTLSHKHSFTHSPLLRGRRGTMCISKGLDVRPGVPWVSASFAWQAWDNVHCQGVGCTPWRPLGLRLFCVAGVGQCALPRGRMYGVGCTPWRPLRLRLFCVAGVGQCSLPRGRMYALASLGSPPLLRGRRGTMCIAKGSDVRPGVPYMPWRPLGLRLFCVAGVGQCALPRGRMYALASLGSPPLLRGRRGTMCIAKGSDVRPGVPWISASFAWQAWDNVHCQGVRCTLWRPLGLRLFYVAGVGQCALPRGRMYGVGCTPWRPICFFLIPICFFLIPLPPLYALASLGSPSFLRGRRGTMCIPKGSDVRPGVPWVSASFAWQAWDNVHCQGVGCTPWRPLGLRIFCLAGVGQCALPRGRMYALASLGSPLLLRGRRGTMCIAKGSDVCPGVPWVSASFAWQAWDNVHCQGVGCTPWRFLGLRLFCVAGVGNVHCQGVGCTPWRPLCLRLFCVAGVGQCALPRGRMYALASLGSPPLLRGRRGTMCIAKGLDVRGRMYALASLGLRLFCVAGVGQCSFVWHSLTHSPTHSLTHWLTHWLTDSLTHWLTHSFTHSLIHSRTHLCMHIHTHTNSPTITTPSLLYFLFPSCFSMLSLSLKLVTCGVIRSYNLEWLLWLQWSPHPQLLDVVWCSAVVIVVVVWCSGVVVVMCDMCSVAAVAVVIVVWCN